MKNRNFSSFSEFYPFYLTEHSNLVCRRLHFTGCWVALFCALNFVSRFEVYWLLGAIVSGYAFAWTGHFFFEKNKPATFDFPVYSFRGDWVMFLDILKGKVKI